VVGDVPFFLGRKLERKGKREERLGWVEGELIES